MPKYRVDIEMVPNKVGKRIAIDKDFTTDGFNTSNARPCHPPCEHSRSHQQHNCGHNQDTDAGNAESERVFE